MNAILIDCQEIIVNRMDETIPTDAFIVRLCQVPVCGRKSLASLKLTHSVVSIILRSVKQMVYLCSFELRNIYAICKCFEKQM
jgi:hypothetical protein